MIVNRRANNIQRRLHTLLQLELQSLNSLNRSLNRTQKVPLRPGLVSTLRGTSVKVETLLNLEFWGASGDGSSTLPRRCGHC